jgi:hypothetical protein
MISSCDLVAERVALGEPLGDLAEHAASCPRCRRLAALPTELAGSHRDSDPGLGFSARITAGAQHRLVVRRRTRLAAGFGGVVAAAAVVIVVAMRPASDSSVANGVPQLPAAHALETHTNPDPWDNPSQDSLDEDVQSLVHFARVERAGHASAHWDRIESPLAPYRELLKEEEP